MTKKENLESFINDSSVMELSNMDEIFRKKDEIWMERDSKYRSKTYWPSEKTITDYYDTLAETGFFEPFKSWAIYRSMNAGLGEKIIRGIKDVITGTTRDKLREPRSYDELYDTLRHYAPNKNDSDRKDTVLEAGPSRRPSFKWPESYRGSPSDYLNKIETIESGFEMEFAEWGELQPEEYNFLESLSSDFKNNYLNDPGEFVKHLDEYRKNPEEYVKNRWNEHLEMAKEREITIISDRIEYLRNQLGISAESNLSLSMLEERYYRRTPTSTPPMSTIYFDGNNALADCLNLLEPIDKIDKLLNHEERELRDDTRREYEQ